MNIASDVAAALLDSALYILLVDARLLPNYREREMRQGWRRGEQVEDPGRNAAIPLPKVLTQADMVIEVYGELFNANVGKYKKGGFPCFNRAEKQWRWSTNPKHIAAEMNHSVMFDFHVTIDHVEQAQAVLRGRA